MTAIAYGAFLLNLLFGLGVRLNVIPRGGYRRIHHILYFIVMASLAAAILAAILRHDTIWYRLVPMGIILAVMPRFSGFSRGHWIYALFCLIVYSLVLFT